MEKRIKSKRVLDGRLIKVDVDQVELCNKKTAIREVVYHNGGVGLLAIKDNKILLVRQYRYAQQMLTIEIPAGKIEPGEDPYNTGMREIEEETGYRADHLTLFTKALPTPGYCSEVLYLYEAHDIKKVDHPLAPDDDEFINVIEMDIEEAYQQVLDLKIMDAKTVIAIMYAYNKYIK